MGKFDGILICSDYDGTLFYKEFIQSNVEALQYFMDEGGMFTLCTGRRAKNAPLDVMPNVPVVGMCGSEVYDLATGTQLERWTFGEEWRDLARGFVDREDLDRIQFESDDGPHRYKVNDPAIYEFIDTFTGPIFKIIFLYKVLRTDPLLVPPEVREVCEAYLNPAELIPVAEAAVSEADKAASTEVEIQSLRNRIDTLTVNLDKMYMDKLSGILSEADFQRIYLKVKDDRAQLEEQLKALEREKENPVPQEDRAKELVQRFLDSVPTNRELLFSLIERVELSEDKQIFIKFRFCQLNEAG